MLEALFGKKKTPAEMLREQKRLLDKAMRELDRERMQLQQQEKKTIAEIKKMAKEGQMVRQRPPRLLARHCCCTPLLMRSCCCCLLLHAAAACTGRGQGDGQVAYTQPARRHQAARAQVTAAGRVAQDTGARGCRLHAACWLADCPC